MSSTAHGKQPLALRLSMKKQKGKSQAQKGRYTANSIKVVPVGQNFKTSASKPEKVCWVCIFFVVIHSSESLFYY